MGTNFYLDRKPCPTCGHSNGRLHIGKSSAGWCFSLHVIPEDGINDLPDWMLRFQDPDWSIVDECGQTLTVEAMVERITERGREQGFEETPYGYSSWESFHAQNGSEFGPRGMLRHRIDRHCVGHGEGTWDLISGDFS